MGPSTPIAVAYPVYVLDRDGGVERYDSENDLLAQLEAIDVEEGEYEVWDSNGRVIRLEARGLTRWSGGSISIDPSDVLEPARLEELKARVQEPLGSLARGLGVFIRFLIFAPVFPLLLFGTIIAGMGAGRVGGWRQVREVSVAGERMIRRGWWWVKGGMSLPFEILVESALMEEAEPISAKELCASLRDHPYPENSPARVEQILDRLVVEGKAMSISGKYSSTAGVQRRTSNKT